MRAMICSVLFAMGLKIKTKRYHSIFTNSVKCTLMIIKGGFSLKFRILHIYLYFIAEIIPLWTMYM